MSGSPGFFSLPLKALVVDVSQDNEQFKVLFPAGNKPGGGPITINELPEEARYLLERGPNLAYLTVGPATGPSGANGDYCNASFAFGPNQDNKYFVFEGGGSAGAGTYSYQGTKSAEEMQNFKDDFSKLATLDDTEVIKSFVCKIDPDNLTGLEYVAYLTLLNYSRDIPEGSQLKAIKITNEICSLEDAINDEKKAELVSDLVKGIFSATKSDEVISQLQPSIDYIKAYDAKHGTEICGFDMETLETKKKSPGIS